MRIATACQCGKRFQAREDLAGKRVRCPDCGELFLVPKRIAPAATVARPSPAIAERKQFAVELRRRQPAKSYVSVPLLMAFLVLALVLVAGVAIPPLGAILILVICVVAGIAGLIGNIWLIVHAFSEDDVASGVIMVSSFVVPITGLYTLYYLIARWDDSAPFWITAAALGGYGIALLYLVVCILVVG